MNSQRSKVPFTHFAFFSHVAFFNLLVVNDDFPLHHSLWTTGRTILRSVLNMDRGKIISGLSNLLRFDTTSAQGHGDLVGRPHLISFSRRQKCFVGLIRSLSPWFLQSVNMLS